MISLPSHNSLLQAESRKISEEYHHNSLLFARSTSLPILGATNIGFMGWDISIYNPHLSCHLFIALRGVIVNNITNVAKGTRSKSKDFKGTEGPNVPKITLSSEFMPLS